MATAERQVIPMQAKPPHVPPDPTFQRWAEQGLVWLAERGMGYLPVTESPYDADYWRKYQEYAETEMGRALTQFRVDLVDRYAKGLYVCDVGIGCGAFVRARARTFGFDVNPIGIEWLTSFRVWCDPYTQPVDVLTFWDSLEHVPDAAQMIENAKRFVFVSVPIVPGKGPPSPDWKHFRPQEHCYYWTREGLIGWMAEQGFRCLEHCTAESLLGREDIGTFVFARVP